MKKHLLKILLLTAIFGFYACTDHDQDPLAEIDRTFMISAADGNLFEIRSGEIASQKAMNDSVRAYGAHMVMDHSMATQELMALAAKKKMMLPTDLSPAKKMKVDSLNALSGMAFDTTYMSMMVVSHVETVALFEHEASNGVDQEIKSWAASKLPTLKHHLEEAKQLKAALK